MATVISKDRPNPLYYMNIAQHDDGNWEAQPKPVDDLVTTRTTEQGPSTIISPGLRSWTKQQVNIYTTQYIEGNNAAPYQQRNALYCLQMDADAPTEPDYLNAKAMWDWINACREYNHTLASQIDTMTFDQLVVFELDKQNWPAVPPAQQPIPSVMAAGTRFNQANAMPTQSAATLKRS